MSIIYLIIVELIDTFCDAASDIFSTYKLYFQELPELQVFKTVLFHSLVIIALPVLSFFTSKIFVFDGMEATRIVI